jgi:hypothetical protein
MESWHETSRDNNKTPVANLPFVMNGLIMMP